VDKWFGGVEGRGWHVPDPDERTSERTIEDIHLEGTTVAFFWEYRAAVPLWDAYGLLPDDPEWLERELGLSRSLVAELVALAGVQDRPGGPAVDDSQEEERLFLRLRQEGRSGSGSVQAPIVRGFPPAAQPGPG
jgi:hypothetical protein